MIAVLGAGVSGLTSSFYVCKSIARSGFEKVVCFEALQRSGGWFRSEKVAVQNGKEFLAERGPHSFRPVGPSGRAAVKLLEDLGVEKEAVATSNMAKQRYIWHGGRLHAMPTSLIGLVRDPLTRPLPFIGLREALFVPKRKDNADESVYDFFARRFSPYVAETFADALMQGIFAGDIRKLSVQACLPVLHELERDYGSVVGGMLKKGLGFQKKAEDEEAIALSSREAEKLLKATGVSFPGGLSFLIKAMERELAKSDAFELERNHALKLISPRGGLEFKNGISFPERKFQRILSTLPMRELAASLPDCVGVKLKRLASETPFASVGVVNLGWNEMEKLPKPGFGHLVPTNQMEGVLGMIYDSEVFPDQQDSGASCITVMMGGRQFPEYARLSEEEMITFAMEKTREHLGIEQAPDFASSIQQKDCIPQYTVGHNEKVTEALEELKTAMPFLTVFGNSFGGVGIADSIRNARKVGMALDA